LPQATGIPPSSRIHHGPPDLPLIPIISISATGLCISSHVSRAALQIALHCYHPQKDGEVWRRLSNFSASPWSEPRKFLRNIKTIIVLLQEN